MTNAPGSTTYSHDVVGNRLSSSANGTAYAWDHFNRLIELENDFASTQYHYLPNGLRSTKIQVKVGDPAPIPGDFSGFYDENFWQNYPTTRYRYDGQMTLEEDVTYTTGENIKVDETRYTLGVRGIESMVAERVSGDSEPPVTTGVEYRSFPLYDGHGNMIATLERNGTGYTLGAEKRYEVWGSIRAHAHGAAILNPNKGYVANLGHTRDEESGLTYMRARYYEPWTGRFISEDRARDGKNWYVYANSNPTSFADLTGESSTGVGITIGLFFALLALGAANGPDKWAPGAIIFGIISAWHLSFATGELIGDRGHFPVGAYVNHALNAGYGLMFASAFAGYRASRALPGVGHFAVTLLLVHTLALMGYLIRANESTNEDSEWSQ